MNLPSRVTRPARAATRETVARRLSPLAGDASGEICPSTPPKSDLPANPPACRNPRPRAGPASTARTICRSSGASGATRRWTPPLPSRAGWACRWKSCLNFDARRQLPTPFQPPPLRRVRLVRLPRRRAQASACFRVRDVPAAGAAAGGARSGGDLRMLRRRSRPARVPGPQAPAPRRRLRLLATAGPPVMSNTPSIFADAMVDRTHRGLYLSRGISKRKTRRPTECAWSTLPHPGNRHILPSPPDSAFARLSPAGFFF